jgi:uncharacterized protein
VFFDVATGLATGGVLGYVLQKGGFCMHTAFRSIVFEKDHSTLRAWLLALAIDMIIVNLLFEFRVINIQVAPFFWLAASVGGLVFGIGMVLAGGCTSGTWYRAGKGMLGSAGALVGYAIGATSVSGGLLRPVMDALRRPVIDFFGEDLSITHALPFGPVLSRWAVIAIAVAAIIYYLSRAPEQKFATGWKWPATGTAIGLVGVAAWLASTVSARDYGMSFTQPTVSIVRVILSSETGGVNWATFMVLGVPIGAFAAAVRSGDFAFRLPAPKRFVQQSVGGVVMGLGAAVAGGCNIGHGITGLSVLSVTSLLATATTMAGVWLGTWVVFRSLRKQKTLRV